MKHYPNMDRSQRRAAKALASKYGIELWRVAVENGVYYLYAADNLDVGGNEYEPLN